MAQNLIYRIVFTICLIALQGCHSEIPSDIEICRAGDVECIVRTTTDILRRFPNGNPGLGLRSLEPVHLEELVVSKAVKGNQIQVDLTLFNVDLSGLSGSVVNRVVGFNRDPIKSKFEVNITTPLLQIKAQYAIRGRILLLPIVGNGTVEVDLKNYQSIVKVKLKSMKSDGKLYVTISQINVQSKPENMTVKVGNLFDGNRELGKAMNQIINDNWNEVWTELETGITGGTTTIIKNLISDVFKTIPYDDFYIREGNNCLYWGNLISPICT